MDLRVGGTYYVNSSLKQTLHFLIAWNLGEYEMNYFKNNPKVVYRGEKFGYHRFGTASGLTYELPLDIITDKNPLKPFNHPLTEIFK